jgi:integrase/recombinase XerD
VLRDHMRIVRNLCRYRRRTESGCFVPDKHLFPDPHPPIRPYIFSYPQITCLLKAASDLPGASVSPIRAAVFRLAIVLLYTAGLRRGELLRLCVGDYDSHTRTLSIRETKFHSTRYLPLSANAAQELEDYLRLRRQHRLPLEADTPLIWNAQGGGRAYTDTTLRNVIRKLLAACEIRTAEGRLPRIHDLRHTFAVHALLRWYHLGLDLQAKLPLLAIYMGHVSIVSTEYYLHFVDDIAAVSSDRFAAHCAALVRPLSANGDVQ